MSRRFPTFSVFSLCAQPVLWAIAVLLWRSGLLARFADDLARQAYSAAPAIALVWLFGFAVVTGVSGVVFAVAALTRAERPRFLAYLGLATNLLVPWLLFLNFRS